ncbi:hypothetical protein MUK42_28617 [Musa troglodytarum]|uniref:Uncharacterized protein n=1 Tax=Musa troglodytarum TaxID=320322 RepID=A0A9E7KD91_9LILI|nr:hypothetical protein MUK42_28617 [Musa troglodytarum]
MADQLRRPKASRIRVTSTLMKLQLNLPPLLVRLERGMLHPGRCPARQRMPRESSDLCWNSSRDPGRRRVITKRESFPRIQTKMLATSRNIIMAMARPKLLARW